MMPDRPGSELSISSRTSEALLFDTRADFRVSAKRSNSSLVLDDALTMCMTSPMMLKTPSGTWPKPPHFGQGPDLLPDKLTFVQFSMKKPDGKAVPQLSQKAGIIGTWLAPCESLCLVP